MIIFPFKDVWPQASSVSKDKLYYAPCMSDEIWVAPKKSPDGSQSTTWWISFESDLCCLLSNVSAKAAEGKPHICVGTAVH